jgi:hypothetical protein
MVLRKHGGKIILAGILTTALVYGCGKKKKSSDSSGDSELAAAYPLGLNIAIYPQTNSTSLSLSEDLEQSVKAKNEEAAKRIRGEAECFPTALGKVSPQMGEDKCYEFDSEMIYLTQGGSYVNGTKDGKSQKAGSSEACMVSFARGKIRQITGMVDRTLGMVQMMICQARKSGAAGAPSADGQSVDFKAIMEAAATAAGKDPSRMPVSAASMTLSSGKYVTEIAMKMPTAPNSPPTDSDPVEKITLTHNPSASDENAYTGTIVIRRTRDFDQNATKERILTINYERSNGRVKYKLLTAAVNTDISANAVVDGILNLNVSTNSSGDYVQSNGQVFSNQNNAVSGIMMVGFDMNPDTNDGNFSYWVNPGAGYTEKPRGFVANITANSTTGLMAGCSSSGAFSGGSIRKSIKDSLAIKPDGSYHPFACNNSNTCTLGSDADGSFYEGSRGGQTQNMYVPAVTDNTVGRNWTRDQMTAYVARQCFTQDSTGVYNIDTSSMPGAGSAGYELLQSNSTSLPTPPDLGSIQ